MEPTAAQRAMDSYASKHFAQGTVPTFPIQQHQELVMWSSR